MGNKNQIEIPKYIICLGIYNVPSDLKKVRDYFSDCGNKNYQVCLVGKKEALKNDLKKLDYQGKNFIYLDNKSLNDNYPFLSISVKNAIRRVNRLISNPENDFNKSNLGIHTLGLLPLDEKKKLNEKGYGKTSWYGAEIYMKIA